MGPWPLEEPKTISCIRVSEKVRVKGVDIVETVQQTVCDGDGKDGVVGESRAWNEELEVGRLRADAREPSR
jgi:hypothetical protein